MITSSNLSCMSCKVEWSNEFAFEHFSKSFIAKDLSKVRKVTLLNQQRLLLVNSMEDCKQYKLVKEYKVRIRQLQKEVLALAREKVSLIRDDNYKDRIYELDLKIAEKKASVSFHERLVRRTDIFSQMTNRVTQSLYISCSLCKGVIIDGKCGLCQTEVCRKCYTMNTNTHECSEEAIQTYQNLLETVKSCPSCKEGIYKINGCDIMFCTRCKTGFNWSTLEIIRDQSQIHNPHFFEHRVDMPDDDILIHPNEMRLHLYENRLALPSLMVTSGLQQIRDELIGHIDLTDKFLHLLRLKYLSDEITEAKWRDQIYRVHRNSAVYRAIVDMINRHLSEDFIMLTHRVIMTRWQTEIDIIDSEMKSVISTINTKIKSIYTVNGSNSNRHIKSTRLGGFDLLSF